MRNNPITDNLLVRGDSYKWTHHNMMVPGTEFSYSNIMARKASAMHSHVLWYGALNYILPTYLAGPIITRDDIAEAKEIQKWHMPGTMFNPGWDHIVNVHGGRLPVKIQAAPEGLVLPVGNVLLDIVNTDKAVPFLPDFLETILVKAAWYPMAVATSSLHVYLAIRDGLVESGCDPALADFMLQDFGYRGVSSEESAALGGSAHLLSFLGTDTPIAMVLARKFYGAMKPGFSVAASQHSNMTALGRTGEHTQATAILGKHQRQIVSLVADSYDYYAFVDWAIGEQSFVTRNGITLVIRPDSVTKEHPTPESIVLWTLNRLADKLGYTSTGTGHRVVNGPYRVLYGDGLDYAAICRIIRAVLDAGFALSNIACFGEGGGLLQKVTRDDDSVAMKCSAQYRDGEWLDIVKDPLDARKKSMAGRLALVCDSDGYHTIRLDELKGRANLLQPVFENGVVLRQESWDTLRGRVKDYVESRRMKMLLDTPQAVAAN